MIFCNDNVGLMIPTLSSLLIDEGTNAIVVLTIMEESRDSSTIQFILPYPPPHKAKDFPQDLCLQSFIGQIFFARIPLTDWILAYRSNLICTSDVDHWCFIHSSYIVDWRQTNNKRNESNNTSAVYHICNFLLISCDNNIGVVSGQQCKYSKTMDDWVIDV